MQQHSLFQSRAATPPMATLAIHALAASTFGTHAQPAVVRAVKQNLGDKGPDLASKAMTTGVRPLGSTSYNDTHITVVDPSTMGTEQHKMAISRLSPDFPGLSGNNQRQVSPVRNVRLD